MKIIALVATSLALLSTGATAQDAQSNTNTVKVTSGSVVTLYSIPKNEMVGKGNYATISGDKATYDKKSGESRLEDNVVIRLGKSFKVYADKATFTNGAKSFIVLQSDGKIESNDGEHEVTQLVYEGTRIDLP